MGIAAPAKASGGLLPQRDHGDAAAALVLRRSLETGHVRVAAQQFGYRLPQGASSGSVDDSNLVHLCQEGIVQEFVRLVNWPILTLAHKDVSVDVLT